MHGCDLHRSFGPAGTAGSAQGDAAPA